MRKKRGEKLKVPENREWLKIAQVLTKKKGK